MSKTSLLSAGYTGHRLCRPGNSSVSPVDFDASMATLIISGWKYNIIYTNKKWYGCGDNDHKQMGDQIAGDISVLTELPDFADIVPISAACGDKLTAIAASDGSLYLCGNSFGSISDPLKLKMNILFVACGTESVVAIPDGPGIYWFTGNRSMMNYFESDIHFVDAAAGQNHFLALSDDGHIYSWGSKKPCGQGKGFSSNTPTIVSIKDNTLFSRVFAYNTSSFAIDTDGNVWSCGSNGYGQIGQGQIQRCNTFQKITPFIGSDETIIHIASGDTMTYFLTDKGTVYACGERDNDRLCMQTDRSVKTPTLCDWVKEFNISWVSAGCSHVMFLITENEVLPHPFLLKNTRGIPIIWKQVIGKNSCVPIDINISDEALMQTGFRHGDVVTLKESNNEEATVIGISTDKTLYLQSESGLKIYKDDVANYHYYIKLAKRIGSDSFVSKESRCKLSYDLDCSESACLAFGFFPGDEIEHPELGNGKIEGVFGNKLFISWTNDENLISTGYDCSPSYLHSEFTITKTNGRTIKTVFYQNKRLQIEISPCKLIGKYGFKIDDLVLYQQGFYVVVGQFCHKVLLKNEFDENNLELTDLNSLLLLRRESEEKTIVSIQAFNTDVVDVLVNYQIDDEYWPTDRVITSKGIATIIGKDVNGDGYWVQTDDALRLNFGAVLTNQKEMKIIRRIGGNKQFSVAKITKFIPGDIISYDNKFFLVNYYKDDSGELSIQNKEEKVTLNDDDQKRCQIISRKGLNVKKPFMTKMNVSLETDVNIDLFRGMRVLPGDVVETPNGLATVIGIAGSDIWLQPQGESGAVTTFQQAFYDPNVIKIYRKIDNEVQ
ncbi:RCC1 repeat-containing protein [Histomonas meleagridis]|uniref:RCC1 repeat-containing protein n=1 Tax=Histomonas meleagridis TaxID=135588 RepID=UPI003559F9E0|nr:RCC1 repeat-containing protein [Histomonas meleagridis]KAH0800970.1 RCC1 repeat-containing protein [Histomonas meleagridis]